MTTEHSLNQQAQRLRAEFDDAFGKALLPSQVQKERFVKLTVAGAKYAVPLGEVAMLQAKTRIVPIPSSNRRLLGLCCVRGELLAVFDLAACLEHEATFEGNVWIARALGTTAAFAFEHCDGQVQGAVRLTAGNQRMLACDGELLPLISLNQMIATLGQNHVVSGVREATNV